MSYLMALDKYVKKQSFLWIIHKNNAQIERYHQKLQKH
ncbi:hypothetical protein AO382_0065 [Moraxella catarrhalis]|uniref:Uncharacterized protein n=1 Tax=Moraxella catarrhalis TaxID=480 RepID=A0A7Z1A4N1_MORCA|nr:hypothetical protein AO382_0065 [Moraxella catarrhalis]